jgi:hypothetical protein
MIDLKVKKEPEQTVETNLTEANQSTTSVEEMYYEGDDEDGPVVKELDVYLSRSLANNVYILQVLKKLK